MAYLLVYWISNVCRIVVSYKYIDTHPKLCTSKTLTLSYVWKNLSNSNNFFISAYFCDDKNIKWKQCFVPKPDALGQIGFIEFLFILWYISVCMRSIPSRWNSNYLQCSWFSVARIQLGTYKPQRIPILNERREIFSWFVWRCHAINCIVLLSIAILYLLFVSFHSIKQQTFRWCSFPCISHCLYGIIVVIIFYSFNMQFRSNL